MRFIKVGTKFLDLNNFNGIDFKVDGSTFKACLLSKGPDQDLVFFEHEFHNIEPAKRTAKNMSNLYQVACQTDGQSVFDFTAAYKSVYNPL